MPPLNSIELQNDMVSMLKITPQNLVAEKEDVTTKSLRAEESAFITDVQHAQAQSGQMGHKDSNYWQSINEDIPITFYRNQQKGIGDIISALSAVTQLRELVPNKIIFQTHIGFKPIIDCSPHVDEFRGLEDKIAEGEFLDISKVCALSEIRSIAETGDAPKSRNQIFTESIGLSYKFQRPTFLAPKSAINEITPHFRMNDISNGNIGLVLNSAEKWKDYPYNLELLKDLCKKGFTVYTLDINKGIDYKHPNHIPVTGLSLTALILFVSYLDLLISPDTGTLHISEALMVPSIGLFGSMGVGRRAGAYQYRTTQYIADSNCGVQPCYYARCRGSNQYQPCMEMIHPRTIVKSVSKFFTEGEFDER